MTEALFSDIAQMGVVFALLVAIIIVLARRIVVLEKKIDGMNNDRFEEAKENILIIKEATTAMHEVAQTRCKYDED